MYKINLAPIGDACFYAYVLPTPAGSDVWIFREGFGEAYCAYGAEGQIAPWEVQQLDAEGYFSLEKQILGELI